MVITVLQFVLAIYLMCIILKDVLDGGSSKQCFSGTCTMAQTIFCGIGLDKMFVETYIVIHLPWDPGIILVYL
jgi:hypothetical protein